MGRVERIWIKPAHLGPMEAVPFVEAERNRGLAGNANRGGRRQVTLLARESWQRTAARAGLPLDPVIRRANILLSGVVLEESGGRVLRLGECRIRILGETRPCARMDEAHPGLRRILEEPWAGGAYGQVLRGGRIAIGMEAAFAD